MGASLHCDTVEQRAERLGAPSKKGFLAVLGRALTLEWCTEEWDELYTPDAPRKSTPRISYKDEFNGLMKFQGVWQSKHGRSFRLFRKHALRAMVDALAELDRQGKFGASLEREKVVVFVEITDSYDAYFCLLESVRMLNPPAARRRFNRSFPFLMWILLNACYGVHRLLRGRVIAGISSDSA